PLVSSDAGWRLLPFIQVKSNSANGGSATSRGVAPAVRAAISSEATANPADRKSTRLNSSHLGISYAVFCLKKKNHRARHISRHEPIRPERIRRSAQPYIPCARSHARSSPHALLAVGPDLSASRLFSTNHAA